MVGGPFICFSPTYFSWLCVCHVSLSLCCDQKIVFSSFPLPHCYTYVDLPASVSLNQQQPPSTLKGTKSISLQHHKGVSTPKPTDSLPKPRPQKKTARWLLLEDLEDTVKPRRIKKKLRKLPSYKKWLRDLLQVMV